MHPSVVSCHIISSHLIPSQLSHASHPIPDMPSLQVSKSHHLPQIYHSINKERDHMGPSVASSHIIPTQVISSHLSYSIPSK